MNDKTLMAIAAEQEAAASTDQQRDAQVEAIAVQFVKSDKQGFELAVERGRWLKEVRHLLKQHKSWVKWHTERLRLDPMAVNKLIRRADAAEKYGIKNLIKLGMSVIDILIAPEVPEEAVEEGIERSKTKPITCAEARRVASSWKDKKGREQVRGRRPKNPTPEVTLKNTPLALARHLATYPLEVISDIAARARAQALEGASSRRNSSWTFEAVQWVRPALPSRAIAAAGNTIPHYYVRDGLISAFSGSLLATTPFPHDGPFLVDAACFARELADNPQIAVSEDHVTCEHADRSKSKLTNLPLDNLEAYRQPEGERYPLPSSFWSAAVELRRFFGDRNDFGYANGFWITNGKLIARHIRTVASVRDIGIDADVIIPLGAIDFVLDKRLRPIELLLEPDRIWFLWEDGSSLGAVTADRTKDIEIYLGKASELLETWSEPRWAITEEWRTGFQRVSDIGAKNVQLYADRMSAAVSKRHGKKGTKSYETEVALETPLPENLNDGYLDVSARVGKHVLEAAEAIDLTTYPEPSPFKGGQVVGLIDLRGSLYKSAEAED